MPFLTLVAGVRLEFVGNAAVGLAAAFAVLQHSSSSGGQAGLVGLSVSYALDITNMLNWLIRMFTASEAQMVGVERVRDYSYGKEKGGSVPVEAAAHIEGAVTNDWPSEVREQVCFHLRTCQVTICMAG